MSLFTGNLVRYAKDSGRWITIGGTKGEDGKRHGGSPVYIENGRITKGAASLTGKKIDALQEDAEPASHRKELHQAKGYGRAKWAKKAKAEGIESGHLHQLAGEILAHDREFNGELKKMLQETRKMAADIGSSLHHKSGFFEGGDHTHVKGFDIVAREMAGRYPHILGAHGYGEDAYDANAEEASEKLFDLLRNGNPEPMAEEEAYEQAFGQLASGDKQDTREMVPFQMQGNVERYSLFTGNRLTYAQAADLIRYQRSRYAATGFVEADHPRDGAGKFTDGGDSADSDSALDASGEPMWKAWQKKRKAELAGVGAIKGDGSGPEAKLYDPPAAKPTQVAAPERTKVEPQTSKPPNSAKDGEKPVVAHAEILKGLGISKEDPEAESKLSDLAKAAEKKARTYEGMAKRAANLFKRAQNVGDAAKMQKYRGQMEMYGNLEKQERGKPGLMQQLIAIVTGKPATGTPAKPQGGTEPAPAADKPAEANPDASPFEGWHAQTQADRWIRHREGGYYEADTQQVERYSLFGRR